ncbi:MAG: hypothetical protein ACRCVT_02495, partial [Leadbetterella sp.]
MNSLLKLSFFLLSSLLLGSCSKDEDVIDVVKPKVEDPKISPTFALKWAKATTDFIRHQPSSTPTYISRALGYMGLTMYESVVSGSKLYQSVAPSLNGLGVLPKPTGTIDWEISLNESQFTMLFKLYLDSPPLYKNRVDSLYKALLTERTAIINDTTIIGNSKRFGALIANKIHDWAKEDGGNLGYYKNFDAGYKFPIGGKHWVAPVNGQSSSPYPLHPYWGQNRTFVKSNTDLSI